MERESSAVNKGYQIITNRYKDITEGEFGSLSVSRAHALLKCENQLYKGCSLRFLIYSEVTSDCHLMLQHAVVLICLHTDFVHVHS